LFPSLRRFPSSFRFSQYHDPFFFHDFVNIRNPAQAPSFSVLDPAFSFSPAPCIVPLSIFRTPVRSVESLPRVFFYVFLSFHLVLEVRLVLLFIPSFDAPSKFAHPPTGQYGLCIIDPFFFFSPVKLTILFPLLEALLVCRPRLYSG